MKILQCPDLRFVVRMRFSREAECVRPQVVGIAASRGAVRTRDRRRRRRRGEASRVGSPYAGHFFCARANVNSVVALSLP